MIPIKVSSIEVRRNAGGLISLTDLFKASGITSRNKSPMEWARRGGEQFIAFVAESINTAKSRIYQTSRGKNGGTFAHWQIALAYAKYLSPELHMQVNEVYARFQAGDVTLAAQIADKAKPEDAAWLAKRTQGIVARNKLTSTLQAHEVTGKGYADCTNAIYRPILGGKKSEICAQRGLRKSTNLRDLMTTEQIIATSMSELVAAKQIDKFNVRGNTACANECARAAQKVATLLQ